MNSATLTITATINSFTGGTIAAGTQFDFTINTIKNSISLEPSNMQAVTLVDSLDNDVNTYAAASTITITNTIPGDITNQVLNQSTDVAGAEATYTFTFTPTNPIPQNAKIELIYTNDVTVPTNITCQGLSGIPSGTVLDCLSSHNIAANTLTLLNGFNSTFDLTSVIIFQIAGISNPTTASTTSFTLSTLTDSDFRIDTVSTGLVPQLECNSPCKT